MTEKAPELDQDGKMINPHNPDFITKVPWYLGNTGPTLKHHNIQKVDHFLSMNEADELLARKYQTQKNLAKLDTKTAFKKGACRNCGASTHKEKDCVERPRSNKKAAWKSGVVTSTDDVTLDLEQHGKVSYSAKRDYWKGYNPKEYKEVVDKYNRLDEEKRIEREDQSAMKALVEEEKARQKKQLKNNTLLNGGAATRSDKEPPSDNSFTDESDSDNDADSTEDLAGQADIKEFIERDESARDFQGSHIPQGGIGGNGMKMTARNLRLREDTPKYLLNLALDSAFYDPKSRSMRSNPLPDENPEDLVFAGDNFVRHSGDALKLAANQVLCWEMQARGESIDVISNPSQAELVQKQYTEKKQDLINAKRKEILQKYLDDEELQKVGKGDGANQSAAKLPSRRLDPRLRFGQTEQYVEYSRDGRPVNAPVQSIARTKYEEDVHTNNHTSVWGSYFCKPQMKWGYQCCHSLIRNAFCTGVKGKAANDAANGAAQTIDAFQARKMLESKPMADRKTDSKLVKRSDVFGDASGNAQSLDAKKVQLAIDKFDSRQAQNVNDSSGVGNSADERKRGYNSMKSIEVDAEDMEAYRLKKLKADDPMAKLIESEELLQYK